MPSYEDSAARDIERDQAFLRWLHARIEAVHRQVTAVDVLARHSISLRYGGNRAEQMFCPFHGNARTPAARYHPNNGSDPDHVWCFVCNERWDCIHLFRKFENLTSDKFSAGLRAMERAYGITPPEKPPAAAEDEPDDIERRKVEEYFALADFRLKESREAFDMRGYFTVGSVLDRLRWQFENGKLMAPAALAALTKINDKITEKAKAHAPKTEGFDP